MKDCPGNTIGCEEMTKESTDISELVGLVSMDRVVVFLECFLEVFRPDSIEFTESFSDETVELRV
jgi:hypothetical protein